MDEPNAQNTVKEEGGELEFALKDRRPRSCVGVPAKKLPAIVHSGVSHKPGSCFSEVFGLPYPGSKVSFDLEVNNVRTLYNMSNPYFVAA